MTCTVAYFVIFNHWRNYECIFEGITELDTTKLDKAIGATALVTINPAAVLYLW